MKFFSRLCLSLLLPLPTLALTPVQLQTNEMDMYLAPGPLAIQTVAPLASGVGVRVTLASVLPGLQNTPYVLKYFSNGTLAKTNPGALAAGTGPGTATLDIPFDAYRTSKAGIGTAVTLTFASTRYFLGVNYYSPAYYAAGRTTSPGVIVLRQTTDPGLVNVPLGGTPYQNWVVDRPSQADIATARATWGKLVSPKATPTANAQAIAKALIDALETHRGIPSDAMNRLSPFEQYRHAVDGIPPDPKAPSIPAQVYCSNITAIFSHACNCLGIPARIFTVEAPAATPTGQPPAPVPFKLYAAEGHSTPEIFDASRNRWVWLDPTLYMLEMDLDPAAGNDAVGIAEMIRALDDPAILATMVTKIYVPLKPAHPYLAGATPGTVVATPCQTIQPLASSHFLSYDILRFFGAAAQISTLSNGAKGPVRVPYASNQNSLFPGEFQLAVATLQPPSTGVAGADFQLVTHAPAVAGIQYRLTYDSTEKPPVPLGVWKSLNRSSPAISVQFTVPTETSQTRLYGLRTMGANGKVLTEYGPLQVSFYPPALYAKAGMKAVGQVTVAPRNSLQYASPTQVRDWIVDQPSQDDIDFAAATWGSLVQDTATPTANAQAIAIALITTLEPFRGVASPAVRSAAPFTRFTLARSGAGQVRAQDVDDIFAHACNCLGIPARSWTLGNSQATPAGFKLTPVEGSSTLEIFDAASGRWVWIDPGLYLLGARYADYSKVNLADFTRCLNLPGKLANLSVVEYRPGPGAAPTPRPLTDTAVGAAVRRDFGPQQVFTTLRH